MDIRISKKIKVGKKSKPLIIAEVSANHCGSKKIFLKHIIAANKSGADLVKIQTYEPDDMLVTKKFVIKKGLWKNRNLWKLYQQAKTFAGSVSKGDVQVKHGEEQVSSNEGHY